MNGEAANLTGHFRFRIPGATADADAATSDVTENKVNTGYLMQGKL